MKVLLLQNLSAREKAGDVIEVKAGYAQNFLFPQKKAVLATSKVVAELKAKQKNKVLKQTKETALFKKIIRQLDKLTLVFNAKVSKKNTLFAAITADQILEKLNQRLQYQFKPNQIKLAKPLKDLGSFKVGVNLSADFKTEITIKILAN